VAPEQPKDGSSSFARFLAEHDVHCPRCGYNLRGLSSAKCPECGTDAGWGLFSPWGWGSRPGLYRAVEGCVLSAVVMGGFLLAFRLPRAIERNNAREIAASVIIPVCSWVGLWFWFAMRRKLAKAPGYIQARWASGAVALLALALLSAIGANVI
jgi:hypothetical protein